MRGGGEALSLRGLRGVGSGVVGAGERLLRELGVVLGWLSDLCGVTGRRISQLAPDHVRSQNASHGVYE